MTTRVTLRRGRRLFRDDLPGNRVASILAQLLREGYRVTAAYPDGYALAHVAINSRTAVVSVRS